MSCSALALVTAAACLVTRGVAPPATDHPQCKPLPPPGTWFHTSETNAPSARSISYVAASSTESHPLLVLNSEGGGRYDLCEDRWSAIEKPPLDWASYPLPLPVQGGRNLFFVGPTSAEAPFGYFLRFNLDEGRWHALPTKGAPSPRIDQVMAWAGDRFVMLGGRSGIGADAQWMTDGAEFDPASDSWMRTAPRELVPQSIEGVASVGRRILVWPQNVLYEVPERRWIAAPDAMIAPYQPEVVSEGARALVFGGINGSGEGGEYDGATNTWSPLPAFSSTEPTGHLIRFVDGNAVLVPWSYNPSNEPVASEDRASSLTRCSDSPYEFWVLDRAGKRWSPVRISETGNGFCAQLVTASGIVLVHFPPYNPAGFVEDGVIWAIDGKTGALRKAPLPMAGAPTSPGIVRWDGKALWIWRATTFAVSGSPDQCRNHPANMGCDPIATYTETAKPGAWRLEPAWVAVPAAGQ